MNGGLPLFFHSYWIWIYGMVALVFMTLNCKFSENQTIQFLQITIHSTFFYYSLADLIFPLSMCFQEDMNKINWINCETVQWLHKDADGLFWWLHLIDMLIRNWFHDGCWWSPNFRKQGVDWLHPTQNELLCFVGQLTRSVPLRGKSRCCIGILHIRWIHKGFALMPQNYRDMT